MTISSKIPLRRGIKTTTAVIIIIIVILAIIGAALLLSRPPSAPVTTTPTTTPLPSKISFYTWWAGLEKFAIDAVIGNFTARYGISVEKTAVPGGAGVNAKFAILALIQAGKPPAAFQVHCGPEMLSYIYAAPNGENSFVEMSSIARKIGMYDQGRDVLSACSLAGKVYTLPVDIHRANLIFINKHVLDQLGAQPPRTLDDLISLSKKASASGIPALLQAGGDVFTVLHL